jgi:hypothetical protein
MPFICKTDSRDPADVAPAVIINYFIYEGHKAAEMTSGAE